MSLSSALNVALTGLQTSSTLLQLTSDNISNAQTPGFTRKSAVLSAVEAGGTAGGVQIAGYARATDDILQASLNAATSDSSLLSAQNSYMQQVQSILNSNANNPALSDAVAQFAAAWSQLQTSPEDPAVQASVVQAGNNFARQINSVAAQTGILQSQVTSDVQSTVQALNTGLATVNSLNQQIATAQARNQPTGDLEDARDQAINQIASITNVTIFQRNQGQVALYTSDGVLLVDTTPQVFSYNGTSVTTASGLDVTNDLTGGSLQAEIQFNATATPPSSVPGVNTIQKLQGQLTNLVKAFTNGSAFETAYNPGGLAANDFFTATGNDPSTFAVNSSLITDPTSVTQATASNTANTFATNYNFTDATVGLSLASGTTTNLVTTILSGFQQAANTINTQSQSATQQQTYYQQSLSNATGVNIDSELVNLTTLQNSYAASAHVISTINQMFNALMTSI